MKTNQNQSFRLCFERISGRSIDDEKEFIAEVSPHIEDGVTPLRFAGYMIVEASLRIGNCGGPCWQYIIDGDFYPDRTAAYLFNLSAPQGYVIHVYVGRYDENEKYLLVIK